MRERVSVLRVVSLRSSKGRYGGPADTALSQARLLGARGFETTLLYATIRGEEPETSGPDRVRHVAHPVRLLRGSLTYTLGISLRLLLATWREVSRANVVHVSFAREALPLAASVAALVLRRPLILQPHGMLTARTSRLHRTLDRIVAPIFRRAAAVVALTETERDALIALYPKGQPEMMCIGNPLVTPLPDHRDTTPEWDAIFLGRIQERKRPWTFVQAARIAHSAGWQDSYALVGPVQVDEARLANALAGAPNVALREPVSSELVAATILRAKIFVLPSDQEPWGNVLLAALALGRPCVVARSAALSELIERAGAGIIVEDADADALAHAVHELATDPEQWHLMQQNAANLYRERFSDKQVQASLADLVERAVS